MQFGRVLLFSALLFHPSLQAADGDKITIFGTAIPGIFDENEPGPYNTLYNQVIAGVSFPTVLTMLPIRKATKVFGERGADCIFAGSPDESFYTERGFDVEELVISDTIQDIRLKIYGPIGGSPIEDYRILSDINFAIDIGIGEVHMLRSKIPVEGESVLYAQTLTAGFKMLDVGRIQALIAIDVDVEALKMKSQRYRQYPVSDTFVLRKTEDVFVCRKMMRTERFIEEINQRMVELRQTGQLDSLFKQE